MEYIRLSNGVMLPAVGLGTWQVNDRDKMAGLIVTAYECGYRLLDTAAAYSNEIAIGRAVKELGLPREELFLSGKVWNTDRGYEAVQMACRTSLRKLKTDYLDMYLVHWPAASKLHDDWRELNAETWRGMEALYREGLVRAIGVCNFKPHHLEELKHTAKIIPMVDQIEFHPGLPQEETRMYCAEKGIAVEASSPLGNGQILQNQLLQEIAAGRGKTTAQICLRWVFQSGAAAIPKTSNPGRLKENISIFDFELTEAEMARISCLPYCGGLDIDPDEVTEFG